MSGLVKKLIDDAVPLLKERSGQPATALILSTLLEVQRRTDQPMTIRTARELIEKMIQEVSA